MPYTPGSKALPKPSPMEQAATEIFLLDPLKARATIDLLSKREYQVCERVAMGLTTRKIAEELCLSHRTVRNFVAAAFLKMGLHSMNGVGRIWFCAQLAQYEKRKHGQEMP